MQTPLAPSGLPGLGLAQLLPFPLTLCSIIQRYRVSADFLNFFQIHVPLEWCGLLQMQFLHTKILTITLSASYIQHMRTDSKQVGYQFMELKNSYLVTPPRNCHVQRIITAHFRVCPAFPGIKGFNKRTAFLRDGKVDDHSGSSCYSSLKERKLIFINQRE